MPDRPNNATLAALGLLVLGIGWAYGPLLAEFTANTWRNKPHYQHFPFVVAAAVLLFAERLVHPSARSKQSPPGRWGAPLGVGLAWLLLVPAHLIPSPLLAVASFVLLLGGVGCLVARRAKRPFPVGPWALLGLILPPPIGLDGRLIQALQRQSSSLASQALDVLGVNHLMDGNALVLQDKTLFVDEACSGVVSAVSIVSCAAMYGVWRRRGLVHTLLLMGLAAGWAMLLNVVRIVAIALAHVAAGWDWAEGVAHTGVGLAAFGVSLATLVATDWLLKALLAEIGPRWRELTGEPIRFGQWLVDLWDHVVATTEPEEEEAMPTRGRLRWGRLLSGSVGLTTALTVSVAFAAVGGLNLTRVADLKPQVDFPAAERLAAELQKEGAMPEEIDGLKLVSVEHQKRDEGSLFAQHSVVYLYEEASGDLYLVSCDFPYVGGWHELSICYRGIGWRLDGRVVEELEPARQAQAEQDQAEQAEASATRESCDYAMLDLTKPDGRSALVAFCGWFADGSPVEAPAMTLRENALRSLFRRWQVVENRHSFQAQVLAERRDPLTETDRGVARTLLERARKEFVAATTAAL